VSSSPAFFGWCPAVRDDTEDRKDEVKPHMSGILVRRGAWLAALAALTALLSLVTVWQVVPSAQAESGRRLCQYVTGYDTKITVNKKDGTAVQISVRGYLTIDFTKKRNCPIVGTNIREVGPLPDQYPVPIPPTSRCRW
jgi:ferric-dicitrate binding protein FerR (iron transport regulator)